MFLKTLKEKIKFRAGKKYLQRGLNAPPETIDRVKGISSVGCIVDLDAFENANAFYEFVDEFSLRPNSVKIIGYKKFYDKNSPYSTPVFSDKDLGWKANIENSYALEFLNREYDLLVNYYTDEKLLLQLMTLKTKARLKVGFGGVDKNLNDLILNTPIKDFQTFKKELRKYLRVLNEIK
ncbi:MULTISPECIES: hypothetical protein [Arenibacter]|uniref:DUF6913 domain-containing protein n=1 Tax=Arenibacter TaxID=178469 RepID=UPI001C07E46A|nr:MULTISPECIES: hypothetical protein [Arenibacter]MBU2903525.1 hypothetical protein [Arenibacter algicola]MCK0136735.1 hypothetical protein [Arenibacter sp. S6351L]